MESHAPGSKPVLDGKFQGMTLAEVHRALAPTQAVPVELTASKERFNALPDGAIPAEATPATSVGQNAKTGFPAPLAQSTDLNDAWFRTHYCTRSSFHNGYQTCLLNRTAERDLSTDWIQSSASRSSVYVYPYQGVRIHLNGRIDGGNILNVDLLSGSVYRFWMFSGTSIFGCRINKTHRWIITHTAGSGWHWSYGANLDC